LLLKNVKRKEKEKTKKKTNKKRDQRNSGPAQTLRGVRRLVAADQVGTQPYYNP
jgi:hypothetical protein